MPNTENANTPNALYERWKRCAPALLLALLAPLVAEYLSGSMAMAQISILPIEVLLYGTGAVLIRETARRARRGYATIMVLALGYGLLEEGILDQTLFNPHFNGLDLLRYGFVPAIGLAIPWTLYVLAIHVIWSIAVPIALAEALSPQPQAPWLRVPGLAVTAGLYFLGCWTVFALSVKQQHFMANPAQMMASGAAVAACVVLAFVMPSRRKMADEKALPPWGVATLSFLASSAFVLLYGQGETMLRLPWYGTAVGMATLILAALGLGFRAVRRTQWSDRHRLAMAGGALLTYGWTGFATEPALHPDSTVLPHALLAAAIAGILAAAMGKVRLRP